MAWVKNFVVVVVVVIEMENVKENCEFMVERIMRLVW